MANINKIKLSGTTYNIQDLNAAKTVELTQAQYDALTVKDPNTFYIITDAEGADLSNYYTKSEADDLLDTKLDASAYTPTDLSNYYTKSETSGATEISTALNAKQDTLVSGTNIKTINNESILGSGNIEIQGGGGTSYTAGDGIDITNDVISVTGKVDTSTYNTYTAATDTALASKQTTLTAGTNITIVDNVISATGGGGGGATYSAGTNIDITNDTISCTLPIREGSNSSGKGIIVGDSECTATGLYGISLGHSSDASGTYSFCNGSNSSANGQMSFVYGNGCIGGAGHNYVFMFGSSNRSTKQYQFSYGNNLTPKNEFESSFGTYNNSSSASTTFGHSGNTMFSIGNGYDFSSTHNWHNAFEVRQNGDIYVPNTDDTSVTGDKAYSLYPMVRLQDTITATAANTTALGGKVDTSAITTSISSSSTDSQVPSAKAVYDQLGGMKIVKLTESEYTALVTKDSNTLYVVVPDPSN